MIRQFTLPPCLIVTLSLLLLPTLVRADKEEDAAISLATSRAKAEFALKKAQAAVDEHRSGWSSTWQMTEVIRNKTYSVLEARQQAEEKNADDARDQNLLEQIQTRQTKLHEEWDAYNAKDRETLSVSFQQAAETVGHLAQALDALNGRRKSVERRGPRPRLPASRLRCARQTRHGNARPGRQNPRRR